MASPSVPDAGRQGLIPWSTVTKRKVEDCVPSTKPPIDVLWLPGGGGKVLAMILHAVDLQT